jgi:hypothetical protein
VLAPLLRRLEAHVFAAERLHGDGTIVPVLARGKTDTGRCWVYVRDDRPFGGRGSAGGDVLLFARSWRRTSRPASGCERPPWGQSAGGDLAAGIGTRAGALKAAHLFGANRVWTCFGKVESSP